MKAMKRAFEAVVSAIALIGLSPLIALAGIAVRVDSKGPIFFGQHRVGRDGRIFRCWKLRSMHVETESAPTHLVDKKQITRVGRWIRTTKLDELPQLWNVLRGDMSLVGPRPSLPSQSELIAERRKRNVLSVRPGLTGLAQVKGVDMSNPERLAVVDAEYLATRSFFGDLEIMFMTVFARGKGDNSV